MSQNVDVTIPVPRGYGISQALAWAAGEFDRFRERGWVIEDHWLLELGVPATLLTRGRQGELTFRAVQGVAKAATPNPQDADPQGVVARVRLWADGGVDFDGVLTDGQRAQLAVVLGGTWSG